MSKNVPKPLISSQQRLEQEEAVKSFKSNQVNKLKQFMSRQASPTSNLRSPQISGRKIFKDLIKVNVSPEYSPDSYCSGAPIGLQGGDVMSKRSLSCADYRDICKFDLPRQIQKVENLNLVVNLKRNKLREDPQLNQQQDAFIVTFNQNAGEVKGTPYQDNLSCYQKARQMQMNLSGSNEHHTKKRNKVQFFLSESQRRRSLTPEALLFRQNMIKSRDL